MKVILSVLLTALALLAHANVETDAIALIARYEKFRPTWYICKANQMTIGYGFSRNVLTESECRLTVMDRTTADRILGREVRKIQRLIDRKIPRVLSENQKVALTSLIWNSGWTKFRRSMLYTHIASGRSDVLIVREFKNWDNYKDKYGNLIKSKGLSDRRSEEIRLWLKH